MLKTFTAVSVSLVSVFAAVQMCYWSLWDPKENKIENKMEKNVEENGKDLGDLESNPTWFVSSFAVQGSLSWLSLPIYFWSKR